MCSLSRKYFEFDFNHLIPGVGSLLAGEDVYINGDGETSRDFTYIDNVIQMNLLAGTTGNPEAFGEAFNVAVGGRNTLNELYKIIKDELNKSLALNADTPVVKTKEGCLITNNQSPITKSPIYRDFRPGDIRHSNANISKAQTIVGYAPTHDIYQGMEEAIEWYIESIGRKNV